MVTLLQQFEFTYPEGELFYDRAGALARRIRDIFPGLIAKESSLDQKNFHDPQRNLHVFYGILAARFQCFDQSEEEFPKKLAAFLDALCQTFEISTLEKFSFRHVIGRPCASDQEASMLIWPLVSKEQKEKLSTISEPTTWTSLRGTFSTGNFDFETEIAVLHLSEFADREPVPHITSHLQATGKLPIAVADLDVATFADNIIKKHHEEILQKLAPHLL